MVSEVEIPVELYEFVERAARARGMSIEEWIHEAVYLFLAKDGE